MGKDLSGAARRTGSGLGNVITLLVKNICIFHTGSGIVCRGNCIIWSRHSTNQYATFEGNLIK
jgi:hypothetical protein